jgi:hypothetical protein
MRIREVVAIGLKLMAVYVVFQFVMMLPAAIGMYQAGSRMPTSGGAADFGGRLFLWLAVYCAVLSVAYLGFACILFLAAGKLSLWFVTDPDDQVTLSGQVSTPLLTAAFQCMGVYALVTWAPSLIQTLIRTIVYGTWYADQVPFLKRFYDNWSVLISPTMGCIIGLLLIFRAKGLLRLIQRSRPMYREPEETETKQE